MEDLTIHEKMYLHQAISYLKFRSLDDKDKARELAGSSFANSVFDKIYEDLKKEYGKHGIDFPKHPPLDKERDLPSIINFMKNIGDRNWNQLSHELKIAVVYERLYPLCHTEDIVDEIITTTENYYKGNNS